MKTTIDFLEINSCVLISGTECDENNMADLVESVLKYEADNVLLDLISPRWSDSSITSLVADIKNKSPYTKVHILVSDHQQESIKPKLRTFFCKYPKSRTRALDSFFPFLTTNSYNPSQLSGGGGGEPKPLIPLTSKFQLQDKGVQDDDNLEM